MLQDDEEKSRCHQAGSSTDEEIFEQRNSVEGRTGGNEDERGEHFPNVRREDAQRNAVLRRLSNTKPTPREQSLRPLGTDGAAEDDGGNGRDQGGEDRRSEAHHADDREHDEDDRCDGGSATDEREGVGALLFLATGEVGHGPTLSGGSAEDAADLDAARRALEEPGEPVEWAALKAPISACEELLLVCGERVFGWFGWDDGVVDLA